MQGRAEVGGHLVTNILVLLAHKCKAGSAITEMTNGIVPS
jgi:hypothetical protein